MGFPRRSILGLAAGILLAGGGAAQAGQLLLVNEGAQPLTCTVDGWTLGSGSTFDWTITVQPNQTYYVGQNTLRAGAAVIDWADCNGLSTRAMNVTPDGPDGRLVFNGQQTRVLNAALYPYLPTVPGGQFETLVAHVVETFQAQNPEVLLSAQLNGKTDIYSFENLPVLLGPQGLDVIELDTLYMGFLVSETLINPAQITGEQPLDVAVAASTIGDQLWGVPSWLCMDFVYGRDPAIQGISSLSGLVTYLGTQPDTRPALVGDFNGSWRLPSIYINGYVQTYGYGQINQALQMPPDQGVIDNLVSLSDACAFDGVNNCTNGVFHGGANGTTEQVFATGNASTDMGFSEQSFFINYYAPPAPLYVIPAPWGQQPQPLLFSDTFVTSRATCATSSACASDAQAFTTLMTSLDMKNYIVEAQDLEPGSPWRTLLVAAEAFYQQPQIVQNPLYQQYQQVFATAQPFPNAFTAQSQADMAAAVCASLKQAQPAYVCGASAEEAEEEPMEWRDAA